MSPETGLKPPPIGLTLLLAALGLFSIELAICGLTTAPTRGLVHATGLSVSMLVGFAVLERQSRPAGRFLTRTETVVLGVLAVLPFVWHPARLALIGGGLLFESMLMEMLRNLGLALTALARRVTAARLAVVIALFEVLIGASLVDGPLLTALTTAFAIGGAGWLLAGYWSNLPTASTASRPPLPGISAALVVVASIAAVALIGPATAATALIGLVPSSGGSDWSDPEARSGVGDGPNEVEARDSADSIGFTQSDVYLESDQPSLYDAFSETFGEPVQKDRNDRAIALGPNQVTGQREHPSEDHKAGYEFSTHRKSPRPQNPGGQAADALLYQRGRLPAHLRLVAYHEYDGQRWLEGRAPGSDAVIHAEGPSSPWLKLERPEFRFLTGCVEQRLKLGTLETAVVPAPAHLTRFRVGSVNRVDFFEWAQPGIVRMSGRTIPPGTVVDLEVATPRLAALRALPFTEPPGFAGETDADTTVTSPTAARLARTWTEGIPRGWRQVEAVVEGLRQHGVHDRLAVAPADCPDVLEYFLGSARRGPDYLFATAAALMLRSLGYPTRVVGGLYADPERYDPIARHVPVTSADAHLWAEVQVPGGIWVAIEPTPGFDLMPPVLDPLERFQAALAATVRWLARHAVALVLATATVGLLIRRRREALDLACTLGWWLRTPRDAPSRAVLGTLRLVERRASWAGRPRGLGMTTTRWCDSVAATAPAPLGGDLRDLVQLAAWIAYAPGSPRLTEGDCRALCRRVVRSWTLQTFRTLESNRPETRS